MNPGGFLEYRQTTIESLQTILKRVICAGSSNNGTLLQLSYGDNRSIWTCVRLQNLPWYKTGLVSRQVSHLLSKLQNWIWPKTGRYKTGLVSNIKIEASIRATKPKPWQSHLTSDTVELFIQNEKAGLVPMQSRLRSRHKAGFGAAGLGTAQSWFWSRHKASFGAVSRPVKYPDRFCIFYRSYKTGSVPKRVNTKPA